MASDPLLTFDRFRLDPSSGQLHGESGPISLTPKALSLLEYLASRPGRLIMKTELLDALWPDTFVADGALRLRVRRRSPIPPRSCQDLFSTRGAATSTSRIRSAAAGRWTSSS